jgi:hypothetical protein
MGSWEELDRARVAEPTVDEFTRLCVANFAGGIGADLLKMFRAMTIEKVLPDTAPPNALLELEAQRKFVRRIEMAVAKGTPAKG